MNAPVPSRSSPLKLWSARLALAVIIPVGFFAVLEGGLRLGGFGHSSAFMIPDEQPGYYRTNPDFVGLFLPGNFDLRAINFRIAAHKAPNTLRVVVLGESAAQGVPVPTFGFATQLRAQLRAAYPGREIEVLNTGIVAVNSHVVDRIARDMAKFEPDLYVVYMGNNEVIGPYGPGCTYLPQTPPLWVIRASVFVRSTRVGQAAAALMAKLAPHHAAAVEWGGMSMFIQSAVRGDDPRLEAVYRNFEANLRDIVGVARSAGAKVILSTVVSNLKDCPPLLSVHRPGLTADELARWDRAYRSGRLDWKLGRDGAALTALHQAEAIDATYADIPYLLGSLALRAGLLDEARRDLVSAEHWDALRFRPDPRINEVIRAVAREAGSEVTLVDSARAMGSDLQSPSSVIAGREILFEHVHFDWMGNAILARSLAQSAVGLFPGATEAQARLLSAQAVADAVAYTPHERLPMLLRIEVLVRKPPFSNQLTYPEDETRLGQEIVEAEADGRTPAALQHAQAVANAAIAGDPNNPLLAGILEGIELDLGDTAAALVQAKRAQALLPHDFGADADIASLLTQLGRPDEAEAILLAAAKSGADRDTLAPAYADFFIRTKRFGDGLRFIDAQLVSQPADRRLQLVRAAVLKAMGDSGRAEEAYRRVLAADSSNEDALEGLVATLVADGRQAEADQATLAFGAGQQRNRANNLRAAKLAEKAGDQPMAITYLQAAERSGPVNATFELSLALKLYRAHRMGELLDHLAEARLLSQDEGNPSVTVSIEALIARMEREAASAGGS